MSKLKPCPFCGKKVKLNKWHALDPTIPVYSIYCPRCHIGTEGRDSKKQIKKIWNKRVKE